MREKYSGGAELEGHFGERGREEGDDDGADGSREEGADGGGGQGHAGAALEGHLVAVDGRHDGGGLPGQVHQDRGGRPAVLGPVIDPGQHDQRRHGREHEGGRHEHGDRRGRPEAGEDADQRADENADQAVEQVEGRQGRMKANGRDLRRFPCLNLPARSRGSGSAGSAATRR